MNSKPVLPNEFYEIKTYEILKYILGMFCWWLIPAFFSYKILSSDINILYKLITCIPLGYVSSFGIARGQWLGHDAGHNVYPKKMFSLVYTTFFAAITPSFFNISFCAYHIDHHKYVNSEKDPDVIFYSKYKNILSRLFLVRLAKNRQYLKYTFGLFMGNKEILNLTKKQIRILIILNLTFVIFWLSIYIYLAITNFLLFISIILLPTIALVIGSGSVTYQQHANTGNYGKKDIWFNSRSMVGKYWTILYSGGNFHLEHHLYPKVAVWKLPKLHKYLKENGYFEDPRISLDNSKFLGGYKYFSKKYKYPQGDIKKN